MKMRKNIIKKISHSSKKFNIQFKKEIKFLFKKRFFKFKKIKRLVSNYVYMLSLIEMSRKLKASPLKLKNEMLISKHIYINYISHGLDLKFDDLLIQNLKDSRIYSYKNYKGKHILCKNENLNIIKIEKFILLIENNYVINTSLNTDVNDFFYFRIMNFSFLIETYKIFIKNLIIKLIFKCF